MDIENRQQCQLMSEIQHRTGASMRMQVSLPPMQQAPSRHWLEHKALLDQALTRTYEEQRRLREKWQQVRNPDGISFPGYSVHSWPAGPAIDDVFDRRRLSGSIAEPWHFEYPIVLKMRPKWHPALWKYYVRGWRIRVQDWLRR